MLGKHQTINAALAIEAARVYDEKIPSSIIDKGLSKAIWPEGFKKLLVMFILMLHITEKA